MNSWLALPGTALCIHATTMHIIALVTYLLHQPTRPSLLPLDCSPRSHHIYITTFIISWLTHSPLFTFLAWSHSSFPAVPNDLSCLARWIVFVIHLLHLSSLTHIVPCFYVCLSLHYLMSTYSPLFTTHYLVSPFYVIQFTYHHFLVTHWPLFITVISCFLSTLSSSSITIS